MPAMCLRFWPEWAFAKQAIAQRELMPGRFIRVRKMKEQEQDGDLPAIAAAMQIIGASYGGLIAARLAQTHPERVARLVLVDSDEQLDRILESIE